MMLKVSIEVIQKNSSRCSENYAITLCQDYLSKIGKAKCGAILKSFQNDLGDHVESVIIGENLVEEEVDFLNENLSVEWFVYKLESDDPVYEEMGGDEGEGLNLYTHWTLPSKEFHGLWETLIYDEDIKENLLKYTETILLFTDKNVDPNIVSFNRVVLLHGPPGTGKTSLCKALAHKMSIRFRKKFDQILMVEIDSHSLFSKWFSESGKQVIKLFTKIREMIEDPKVFLYVLVDEVESLVHARAQTLSGNEPSDSMKVVNAVLTQMDHIRRFPNVLLLTTSNMTGAIDLAFVDRADVRLYVGLPKAPAIWTVLRSCIDELTRAGLIMYEPDPRVLTELRTLSALGEGLSGRALRKVPLVAYANVAPGPVPTSDFLAALRVALQQHKQAQIHFADKPPT